MFIVSFVEHGAFLEQHLKMSAHCEECARYRFLRVNNDCSIKSLLKVAS